MADEFGPGPKKRKSRVNPNEAIDIVLLKNLMYFKPTSIETAAFFGITRECLAKYMKKKFGLSFTEYQSVALIDVKKALVNKGLQKALQKGDNDMIKYFMNNLCGWTLNGKTDQDAAPPQDIDGLEFLDE